MELGVDWPTINKDLASQARQAPDANFVSKFLDIPYYLSLWSEDIGGLAGKRILDFGCGFGEPAAGVSLFHNPASIVGVDINDEAQQLPRILVSNLATLPDLPNLSFKRVDPGGDFPGEELDFIYQPIAP
jgi:SAM-dependent methyltransferase